MNRHVLHLMIIGAAAALAYYYGDRALTRWLGA